MNSYNIIYIGLKLDDYSKNKLIELSEELFGDEIHKLYCDHITLAYGKKEVEDFDESLIGQETTIEANRIVYDDCCSALVIDRNQVNGFGVHNEFPHITLATFDDFTKPVYSNDMIASGEFSQETMETPISLNAKVVAIRKRFRG